MRALAAILLVCTSVAGAAQHEIDPQDAQRAMAAARQVRDCGFADAEPYYDDEQQQLGVEVRGVDQATDAQLVCAAQVELTSENLVVWMPDALLDRYHEIAERLARRTSLADARSWLAARGLLGRVPRFDPTRDRDEDAFMRQLGALCAVDTTGELDPAYRPKAGAAKLPGPRIISMEWFGRQSQPALDCLWRVELVAGFETSLPGH